MFCDIAHWLQVVYTLVGIVCGTVFFREWRDMSSVALCMYAVGFVGMAVGIRVGISPDELAEGLEQLDGGDNADSDEDVSDGASGKIHGALGWCPMLNSVPLETT